MIKKHLLLICALLVFSPVWAKEIVIDKFLYAGPFPIGSPFMVDTLNVKSEKYSEKEMLKTPLSFSSIRKSNLVLDHLRGEDPSFPTPNSPFALHMACFYLNSDRYTKGSLGVTGTGMFEVYVNGKLQTLSNDKVNLALEPWRYEIIIKYLSKQHEDNSFRVTFTHDDDAWVSADINPEKKYMLSDVTDGKRIQSASISPNGKYVLINYLETFPGGKQATSYQVIDRTNGSTILSHEGSRKDIRWMPKSNLLCFTRESQTGRQLVKFDPVTKSEVILSADLPDGSFYIPPTENYLLFSIQEKGPEKDKDIQEILVPDDRQPGWRNRVFIHKYDLNTGLLQRLTFGHHSTFVNDISPDGRYLLFSSRESMLTERPFSRIFLYRMDLNTLRVDTLMKSAKFISRAMFSPDGKQLLIGGSGDAFDGIGLKIKEGQISNTSDTQLFLYDLASKNVTPLTKDFDPSVDRFEWNGFTKQIYALAKDKDRVKLYKIDPVKRNILEIRSDEDVITGVSFAKQSADMIYFGLSASNSQRLYALDLKKETSGCLVDLSADILKDVRLGEVKDWNFVSSFGDTIYGRYYLPPHFDPAKKYPMIVNYYGGTTPTARVMENRYPSHVYAGLGYIVYIVQPSGATGFGQEFSARHVNAWGKQTAEEIIEGTMRFCDAHPFVNRDKVGCMGASYGGFMTMYLQTKTDIFAAAMSHAGISDITSYWGEGYWGYSYSALASADSYPWNARDMYVNQSPLFSADKINTPILFLHGSADTNVPVGESIQMFTALKLLGKETALIQVEGENHHILDYDKRIRWNHTIYAWFAKWLKDQPDWWDALYPKKNL